MCGIVGYIGAQDAAPILLEGLGRLGSRGSTPPGVAVVTRSGLRSAASPRAGWPTSMAGAARPVQGGAGHRAHALGDPR